MISRAQAEAQTRRLLTLAGGTKVGEVGREELVQALFESAHHLRHAASIVTAWIRTERWLPTPSDIYDLAARIAPSEFDGRRDCRVCGGIGFAPTWVLASSSGTVNLRSGLAERVVEVIDARQADQLRRELGGDWSEQAVYSAVDSCECDYGRHLRQARSDQRVLDIAAGKVKKAKAER